MKEESHLSLGSLFRSVYVVLELNILWVLKISQSAQKRPAVNELNNPNCIEKRLLPPKADHSITGMSVILTCCSAYYFSVYCPGTGLSLSTCQKHQSRQEDEQRRRRHRWRETKDAVICCCRRRPGGGHDL